MSQNNLILNNNTEILFKEKTEFELDKKVLYLFFKRVFDIIFSIFLVILTSPVLLICSAIIKIQSEGPIIYKQERVGLKGKVFILYKLRSMYIDAEKNGAKWADKNDSRITPIGRFIRNTRIDELPQLINIIKGQMSLIGPRPERPKFVFEFEKDIPGFINRVSVKPGCTGWAQINGGYDITPKEKYILDMNYINNISFKIDCKIFFKTIKVVLTGEGAR